MDADAHAGFAKREGDHSPNPGASSGYEGYTPV
jgi:hypothetical protein